MRLVIQIVIALILTLALVALGRDIYNQTGKFKEISNLENKVRSIAETNKSLKEKLKESKTSASLEKRREINSAIKNLGMSYTL